MKRAQLQVQTFVLWKERALSLSLSLETPSVLVKEQKPTHTFVNRQSELPDTFPVRYSDDPWFKRLAFGLRRLSTTLSTVHSSLDTRLNHSKTWNENPNYSRDSTARDSRNAGAQRARVRTRAHNTRPPSNYARACVPSRGVVAKMENNRKGGERACLLPSWASHHHIEDRGLSLSLSLVGWRRSSYSLGNSVNLPQRARARARSGTFRSADVPRSQARANHAHNSEPIVPERKIHRGPCERLASPRKSIAKQTESLMTSIVNTAVELRFCLLPK